MNTGRTFNKDTKNTRKYQTEVTELKNIMTTLEGLSGRLDEGEKRVSDLEDRGVELTQRAKIKKEFLKNDDRLREQ